MEYVYVCANNFLIKIVSFIESPKCNLYFSQSVSCKHESILYKHQIVMSRTTENALVSLYDRICSARLCYPFCLCAMDEEKWWSHNFFVPSSLFIRSVNEYFITPYACLDTETHSIFFFATATHVRIQIQLEDDIETEPFHNGIFLCQKKEMCAHLLAKTKSIAMTFDFCIISPWMWRLHGNWEKNTLHLLCG